MILTYLQFKSPNKIGRWCCPDVC